MLAPPRTWLVALSLLSVSLATSEPSRGADLPKLAGTWNWTWSDKDGHTHRHILEIEGIGNKIAARERFDQLPPVAVTDLKLEGKDIRFAVIRGDHRADYAGVVTDRDTINGKVKVTDDGETTEFVWTAKRETPKNGPAQKPAPPPEQ
jgi:hypothetical protein